MPVQLGVRQRWVVTEREEKFRKKKGETDAPENWMDIAYDTGSFAGRVTLAQVGESGPSYYDTFDLNTRDRSDYEKLKLGAVFVLTLDQEIVEG